MTGLIKNTLIILLGILLLNNTNLNAKNNSAKGNTSWNLTIQTGLPMMLGEMAEGTMLENEFDQHPGRGMDLDLSYAFFGHVEFGFGLGYSMYTGDADLPEFTAVGNHGDFRQLYQQPVEYDATSLVYGPWLRYFIRSMNPKQKKRWYWNPFLQVSGAMNHYRGGVYYQENPLGENNRAIHERGRGIFEDKPSDFPQLGLGTGLKVDMGREVNLIVSYKLNFAYSDYLDAVHNYNKQGEQVDAVGMLGTVQAGVVVPLNAIGGDGRKRRSGGGSVHLPFRR